ncbi:hypothetical protein QE152_g38824 [Popillia japonica]|uniref:Uncharacterized protein n=1 Tax=Popillia japonica TaxID=7064 RepID=A0AAW1HVW5_POPJA
MVYVMAPINWRSSARAVAGVIKKHTQKCILPPFATKRVSLLTNLFCFYNTYITVFFKLHLIIIYFIG